MTQEQTQAIRAAFDRRHPCKRKQDSNNLWHGKEGADFRKLYRDVEAILGQSALAQHFASQTVPEGYKLVPIAKLKDWLWNLGKQRPGHVCDASVQNDAVRQSITAMLAAAPPAADREDV